MAFNSSVEQDELFLVNNGFCITFDTEPLTADFLITFPAKDGTVALLSDLQSSSITEVNYVKADLLADLVVGALDPYYFYLEPIGSDRIVEIPIASTVDTRQYEIYNIATSGNRKLQVEDSGAQLLITISRGQGYRFHSVENDWLIFRLV